MMRCIHRFECKAQLRHSVVGERSVRYRSEGGLTLVRSVCLISSMIGCVGDEGGVPYLHKGRTSPDGENVVNVYHHCATFFLERSSEGLSRVCFVLCVTTFSQT